MLGFEIKSMSNLLLRRYNLIFLAMTYGIPMLAMGVCYTIISRVLWGGSHIGELNQRHVDTIRSKRKVSGYLIFIISEAIELNCQRADLILASVRQLLRQGRL